MKCDFIPVILGTDWNAYGVASSFKMEYDINSISFGMKNQRYTNNLDYLTVYTNKDFDTDEVFIKVLNDFSNKHKDKKLLLISCSDYYTSLISKNREKLNKNYVTNYVDYGLHEKLEDKLEFYNICEKYNLPYPKTLVIEKNMIPLDNIEFDFPIILKPNNSEQWFNIKFEGYKKAYTLNNLEELNKILNLAYNNGYEDKMIIQDFIPGGIDTMYVINAYVSKDGVVRMTHPAQAALDEPLPFNIGNYNALISGEYNELSRIVKEFLEKINYRGYANFDAKFDKRDNKFKFFEINLRQGRSSMYMTYAGNNFIKYIVDDLIYNDNKKYYDHNKEHLWYITSKSVLKKYSPKSLEGKIDYLLKHNSNYGFEYASKQNIKRFILGYRRKLSTIKYYKELG